MKTRDAISLISRIRQKVNGRITSELAKSGAQGLATSHGDIIYALFGRERMTMAEVAETIHRDKSTVTVLINKLVELGYVAKEKDSVDTRVYYVALTQKGKALEPVFETISKEVLAVFYQNISDQEKETLIHILSKIDSNL